LNLTCPHHKIDINLDHPVCGTTANSPPLLDPLINLHRPIKPPAVAKDHPDINLDRPVQVKLEVTEQPDLQLQHPTCNHTTTNLDRPVRPLALSTEVKDISLEGSLLPSLTLE